MQAAGEWRVGLCLAAALPESTPGVSTRVISSRSRLGQLAASNLARKPLPYCARPCRGAHTLLKPLSACRVVPSATERQGG